MLAISADINGNEIYTLLLEFRKDRSVAILEEKTIPRTHNVPQYIYADEREIKLAYSDLPDDTKLFVCR